MESPQPPKPVPITLKGKTRRFKLRCGTVVTVHKTPRGIEISGLEIESFCKSEEVPHDKKP